MCTLDVLGYVASCTLHSTFNTGFLQSEVGFVLWDELLEPSLSSKYFRNRDANALYGHDVRRRSSSEGSIRNLRNPVSIPNNSDLRSFQYKDVLVYHNPHGNPKTARVVHLDDA